MKKRNMKNGANKAGEHIRNAAAANIFAQMASPEKKQKLMDDLRALPDHLLDQMGTISGIPESDLASFRAMTRGQPNLYIDEMSAVDGLLKTGDVILMTGKSPQSQKLVKAQKLIDAYARSSHVAVIHADFICIDAIPREGTSNRIVSEVLSGTESDWRVIRFNGIEPMQYEKIMNSCGYFLWQPYSIQPSRNALKNFSYCSELARKIYNRAGINGTGIPDSLIIKPADFDKLPVIHSEWLDVTEIVRPAIDFCRKRPEIVRNLAKLFIDGLKLNRARFDQRAESIVRIKAQEKSGKISKLTSQQLILKIKEGEKKLNNRFWDEG